MKKILINVTYQSVRGKNYAESRLKNTVIPLDGSIHETIGKAMTEVDNAIIAKRFRPFSNMFVGTPSGEAKSIGYIYKTTHEVYNEEERKWLKIPFDAWVRIQEVIDFELEEINS